MKKITLISLSAFIAVAFSSCTSVNDSSVKDDTSKSTTQSTTQITESSSVNSSKNVDTNGNSSLTDYVSTLDEPMTVFVSSNMELEDEHTVKATDGSFVETFNYELIDGIPTWKVSCTNLTDKVLTINPDLRVNFEVVKDVYEYKYDKATYGVSEVEIQPNETYEYSAQEFEKEVHFDSDSDLNNYLQTNNLVIRLDFATIYNDSNNNTYSICLLYDPNFDQPETSPLLLNDVVDDNFTVKDVSLISTADNTVETEDGSVTLTISYKKINDETYYNYQGLLDIKNNTENQLYFDLNEVEPGDNNTTYSDLATLYKVDENSQIDDVLLHAFTYSEDTEMGISFYNLKIVDIENKILYNCSSYFCAFK